MADDVDLVELEARLLPKPLAEWTPDDWPGFVGTAQSLADKYGKELILATLEELALIHGSEARVLGDVIRHSVRA